MQGPQRLDFYRRHLGAVFERGLEKLRASAPRYPIERLYIELTHRCNLCCVMCDHWQVRFRDPASPGRELDEREIALLSASPLLDGVRQVIVTGGEAMLRRDYARIVAGLARRFPGAALTLLTNFWNTELVALRLSELSKAGVRRAWLSVSLDGVGQLHDLVRGRPSAFSGLERTLALVKREHPGFEIGFAYTVTPENPAGLWQAYEYAKSRACAFVAQPMVQKEELAAPMPWRPGQTESVRSQIDKVLLDLCLRHRLIESALRPSPESWWRYSHALYWWLLGELLGGAAWPFAGLPLSRRFALIDPEGRLFYRPRESKLVVGSVRDSSFDELFLSERADAVRAEADSGPWQWQHFFLPWALDEIARSALACERAA